MKKNIKKQIAVSFLLIIVILTGFLLVTRANKKMPNKSEGINFKLINENKASAMFMRTDQSKITFYLQITPNIKKPYPELFTIFMNGRQIKCLWNNEECTDLYYTTINPNEDRLVEITIDNIPKGLNTLQFGTVYLPDKVDFQETELFSEKYALDLTPFTIVRCDDINDNNNLNWSEESIFNNYNQPSFIDKNLPVGKSGVITFFDNDLTLDLISNVSEYEKIYYYWQNTDEITRKVRYSLLIDWKQVPWPTGEMFIDVLVKPGDIFYKDLLLSEILSNKNCQLSIVAFIDPDKSFWYFNNDDLEVHSYSTPSYATLRNIILSP